jgi:hypothetical protein
MALADSLAVIAENTQKTKKSMQVIYLIRNRSYRYRWFSGTSEELIISDCMFIVGFSEYFFRIPVIF